MGPFQDITSWYFFPQVSTFTVFCVVTFDHFNVSSLNKCMCFWALLTSNFWTVVYVKHLFHRSFRKFSSTSKTDVMDPKKKKKFEKEEKEFRKKFKVRSVCLMDGEWMTLCTNPHCLFLQYNVEIKVLYQATVLQSLSIKKFGNKDLPVKPAEIIDVIVHPVDDKLIGRNSEGKCELMICAVQSALYSRRGNFY